MNNSKTLTFKIAVTILSVVFFAVCVTSGIVFATITSSISTNISNVQTARLFTELWSGGTAISAGTSAITANSTLTVSATQKGGQTAVEPYCVMRAVATNNFTFDTANWIKQDNGWYYCTQVVGGGNTAQRVPLGTTSGEFNNTTDKIVVELMQFSSNPNGFAKFWSPLAGRTTNIISQSSTIDGKDFSVGAGSASDVFVPFNPEYDQYMSIVDALNTYGTEESALIAPIPAGTYSSATPVDLTINSLNKSTANDNLLIYNNSVVPMVLHITYTPSVWERVREGTDYTNNYKQGTNSLLNNATITLGSVGDNFVEVASDTGKHYIYTKVVMPGEYVTALSDTVSFTYGGEIAGCTIENKPTNLYAVRVVTTIEMEEIDLFYEHMQDTSTNGYGIFTEVYNQYKDELKSNYWDWLTKLTTNAEKAGLTMPIYTKLGTNQSGQT